MSLRPVAGDGGVKGVLLHSRLMVERQPPPIDIHDFAALRTLMRKDGDLPIVRLCSFCQKVSVATAGSGEPRWASPADYYRAGGTSQVRLSHGICDARQAAAADWQVAGLPAAD